MPNESHTFKKIVSLADIGLLQVGMSVYKYPLRGNPVAKFDIHPSNHLELIIKYIEPSYIVLITAEYNSEATPIAKEFDRLIADDKWWFKIESD